METDSIESYFNYKIISKTYINGAVEDNKN